eukprot:977706-Pyramimonas_sp.AAC.2
MRTACAELRARRYTGDRIARAEVMTSAGAKYLGGFLSGDYQLLRVATPADSRVRLPGKRAGPHCQRIQHLMVKARALRMSIVLLWPPGYFWRVGPTRDAIGDLGLHAMRLRCCHYGLKFDRSSPLPSGSHLPAQTTYARTPANLRKCTRQVAGEPAEQAEHELDWYGQGAQWAEWRSKTTAIMTARLNCQIDHRRTEKSYQSCTLQRSHSSG